MKKVNKLHNILGFIVGGCIIMNFCSNTYGKDDLQKATFAGGCFWCMEAVFSRIDGVVNVVSGYSGGKGKSPSYQDYTQKGYLEAVDITFDDTKLKYEDLLKYFWENIDPTDRKGQFVDRGKGYVTTIFYHNEIQKIAAERTKQELEDSGIFNDPIVTVIRKYENFYPAEEYHQDYYRTNPLRYETYKYSSGREKFLEKIWTKKNKEKFEKKDPSIRDRKTKNRLKQELTSLQYMVTQECSTEPAFNNLYWNNKKEGIYVDIVSGEPLFSSKDKFSSGTGWPSFFKTLEKDAVIKKEDRSSGMIRTEIRSRRGDSHLGHLFNDGPKPTGLRYCVNSASLRFIPKEDLKNEGYEKYLPLFEK